MSLRSLPILALLVSLGGGLAFAQSAAELAEREKRRREALEREGVEAPSFSDEDLAGRKGESDASEKPSGARPAVRGRDDDNGDSSDDNGDENGDSGDENGGNSDDENDDESGSHEFDRTTPGSKDAGFDEWSRVADLLRFDIEQAREALDEAEEKLRDAQSRRGPRRQPGITEDLSQDPNHQLTRDTSLDELRQARDEARRALDAATQAQADFEREARRKGVPPGWIR